MRRVQSSGWRRHYLGILALPKVRSPIQQSLRYDSERFNQHSLLATLSKVYFLVAKIRKTTSQSSIMSSRVGLRFYSQWARSAAVRAPFRNRQALGKRFQTTDATTPAPPPQNLFQRLWTSEVGVKTVHFWYVILLIYAGD